MILIILAISFSIYYVLLLSRISHGWSQYKKEDYGNNGKSMFVTILIPFRNEEGNLKRNWDSIARHLNSIKDEIIYINDHSNDAGCEILEELIANQKNARIIHLPEGKTGKKEALEFGIETANN